MDTCGDSYGYHTDTMYNRRKHVAVVAKDDGDMYSMYVTNPVYMSPYSDFYFDH